MFIGNKYKTVYNNFIMKVQMLMYLYYDPHELT